MMTNAADDFTPTMQELDIYNQVKAYLAEIDFVFTTRQKIEVLNFMVRDEAHEQNRSIYNFDRTNSLLGHVINRGYKSLVKLLLLYGASFTRIGSGISNPSHLALKVPKRLNGNPFHVLLKKSAPMLWVQPQQTEACLCVLFEYAKERTETRHKLLDMLFRNETKQTDYMPLQRILFRGMVDLAQAALQLLRDAVPYDPRHDYYKGLGFVSKKNETVASLMAANGIDSTKYFPLHH